MNTSDSLKVRVARRGDKFLWELHRDGVIQPIKFSIPVFASEDAAKASGAEALNFLATPLFSVNSRVVFEQVAALRLPAIYQWAEMAEEGGLMAYGARFTQVFRQRARLLIKVLRGAKPTDLPVEQPTHFDLVINLRTAKAIGHEIPAGLVLRADKLIE